MIAVIAWLTRRTASASFGCAEPSARTIAAVASGRFTSTLHARRRTSTTRSAGVSPVGGRDEQPGAERLDLADVRLEQQALLAREVPVDGAERDAGLGRDVAHLHRVEAALVRERERRVEHPPAPRRLVARERAVLGRPFARSRPE